MRWTCWKRPGGLTNNVGKDYEWPARTNWTKQQLATFEEHITGMSDLKASGRMEQALRSRAELRQENMKILGAIGGEVKVEALLRLYPVIDGV